MIPSVHFVISLILFFVLYPFFGPLSLLVFIGGWLIDLDHMLYYAIRFRSLNYFKANRYFREKKYREKTINIFHTIEFYIIILFLSLYNKHVLIITIGLAAHVITDLVHFMLIKNFSSRYWTITWWIIDKSRKKNK